MSSECHVYLEDSPNSGQHNMAVDEALLERAIEQKHCSLRLYAWSEPTVSLGYFQSPDDVPPELQHLRSVRRLSGGGAIVHHHELTYAWAIPAEHPLSVNPTELYSTVHNKVILVLAEFGLPTSMRGAVVSDVSEKSFLCFAREDMYDVVHQGQKILGGAQRRRKGAVLQHGSLVLQRSEFAPEIRGLRDFGCDAAPMDLAWHLAREIAGTPGEDPTSASSSDRLKMGDMLKKRPS